MIGVFLEVHMSQSPFLMSRPLEFPVLDEVVSEGFHKISFINPFREDRDLLDGNDFFQKIPTLHAASIKKIITAYVLSDDVVFNEFVRRDSQAIEYYLDLYQGNFKGRKGVIEKIQKSHLTILFYQYLQKRIPECIEFLEEQIDKVFIQESDGVLSYDMALVLSNKARTAYDTVTALSNRNLSGIDFQKIDNSTSLRHYIYLWTLLVYLAGLDKKFDKKPEEKKQLKEQALSRLKTILRVWCVEKS